MHLAVIIWQFLFPNKTIYFTNHKTTSSRVLGKGRPRVSGKNIPLSPPIIANPPMMINGMIPPRPMTNGAPILPSPEAVLLNPRAVFLIRVGKSSAA